MPSAPNDDRRRYWFPAKRYGWGWGPPTVWQGWAVMIGWLGILCGGLWVIGPHARPIERVVFVVIMVIALTTICYLTGEPPRWRWGGDK